MRIYIVNPPARKKPKAGDEKTVRGINYVRRQVRTREGYYVVSGSRPVYEWVPK